MFVTVVFKAFVLMERMRAEDSPPRDPRGATAILPLLGATAIPGDPMDPRKRGYGKRRSRNNKWNMRKMGNKKREIRKLEKRENKNKKEETYLKSCLKTRLT